MELLARRCSGPDVHKESVVACLRLVSDGKVTTEVGTFQTTTADLLRWSSGWRSRLHACGHGDDWHLSEAGVAILDDGEFELVLANAARVKAHGLIRASFVPDAQTQEMRNLLRTHKQLVRASNRRLRERAAG
jgi:transposase